MSVLVVMLNKPPLIDPVKVETQKEKDRLKREAEERAKKAEEDRGKERKMDEQEIYNVCEY